MNCFLSARFSRFPLQLLILFCVIGQGSWLFGQSKANREVASDDERLAGKVYDGLAAFAVHRDGILRKRRCLFVEGERYLVGKQSEPQVHPLYYIQVIDRSKRFEYVANGFVNLPGSMGKSYQTQSWNEKILCRGKVRYGDGATELTRRLYPFGEKERQRDENAGITRIEKVFYIDPFEDLISLASELRSTKPTRGMMEKKFLTE